MALKKQQHCVCDLKYHIILVTKYRRPVLKHQEISDRLKEECRRLIDKNNGEVIEMGTDVDHIHILVAFGPDINIRSFINALKTTTSYILRTNYWDLISKYLWGDAFWSASYYVSTFGGATIETLKQYVESQPTKQRKRGNPAWQKGMTSPNKAGRPKNI